MFRRLGVLAIVCSGAFLGMQLAGGAEEAAKSAASSDAERIVGVWRVKSVEIDGQPSPQADARKLTIVNAAGGVWTLQTEDQVDPICRGTSTFQSESSPRQIDFHVTQGVMEGTKFQGIYELEQNSRKLCFTSTEFPRPTDFTSFPGTKRYLLELERVIAP